MISIGNLGERSQKIHEEICDLINATNSRRVLGEIFEGNRETFSENNPLRMF